MPCLKKVLSFFTACNWTVLLTLIKKLVEYLNFKTSRLHAIKYSLSMTRKKNGLSIVSKKMDRQFSHHINPY